MSITTSCPGCKSLFRLPDDLAGQQVRCQKCERLFNVPMAATNVPAAATLPIAPAPAPAQPAPSAATIVDAPPTVQAPPPPQPPAEEEIIDAKVAEPPPPPATPKPALPARPQRPASMGWTLAALALFLMGALVAAGVSAFWVFTQLAPATRISYVAPPPPVIPAERRPDDAGVLPVDGGFDFKKDALILPKKSALPPATLINLTAAGNAGFNDQLQPPVLGINHGRFGNDGPYRLYKVHLTQGQIYHFYVNANAAFNPSVEIFNGNDFVAGLRNAGLHRVIVACRPNRTGDHLLFITSQQRMPGGFSVSIAHQKKSPAISVDLAVQAKYVNNAQLSFNDPLDPNPILADDGPYHEYEIALQVKQEYTFAVSSAAFMPVLSIDEKAQRPNQQVPLPGDKNIRLIYTAPFTGKFRVRVLGDQFGLGPYTFSVERNGEAAIVKQPQMIIAALGGEARYEDQRELKATDASEKGFGPYKAYLLTLEKGQAYVIDMNSKAFEPSVSIYDPSNRNLSLDFGGKNVRVEFQATETGLYRIQAGALRPQELGAYTFQVRKK